jgi:hypothetical protein
MEQSFKNVKNKKIILFSNCDFTYVESKEYVKKHPIDDFYYNLEDLSINVTISLK